jgi:hypothetical protein
MYAFIMLHYRTVFLFSSFFFMHFVSVGQIADTTDEKLLYRNEMSGALLAHTNGFGLSYKRGFHKTGYTKKMYDVEFVTMKNEREIKLASVHENNKNFVFGKQNSLALLRVGIGAQKTLFSKIVLNGVEVRLGYFAGFTAGLAKPVYLDVLYRDSISNNYYVVYEKYNPKNPYHNNVNNIWGKSSFLYGFSELKIHPGAYGKISLGFEYAEEDDAVRALEVGIVVDAFAKPIPLLAFVDENRTFVTFYLSLIFGKKWF